jgi:hypothetical protein
LVLEEAVAACRAALSKQARKRAPLDWANAQDSLGFALEVLGERDSGTARLEAAAAAYRAALEERRRERANGLHSTGRRALATKGWPWR